MKKIFLGLFAFIFLGCEGDDNSLPVTFELEEIHQFELSENNFIVQFEYDQKNVLWVGTFNGGILKVDQGVVTQFTEANGSLRNDHINDIFVDHQNKVWVATDKGVSVFDGESWFSYDMSNTPLFQDYVSEVAVNQFDQVLIGNGVAGNGGLLLYQEGEWQSFTPENSLLPSNIINEIEIDSNGDFWVGTSMYRGNGGILKISQGVAEKVYDSTQGLLYNAVDNLEIDGTKIWLGFEVFYLDELGYPDGGIQQINQEGNILASWFPESTKAVSNRISNMKLSSTGELWFTTIQDDCFHCINGLGVLMNQEKFDILSAINYEIESNVFFTWITEHPYGEMNISQENKIYKIIRRRN